MYGTISTTSIIVILNPTNKYPLNLLEEFTGIPYASI